MKQKIEPINCILGSGGRVSWAVPFSQIIQGVSDLRVYPYRQSPGAWL